MKCGSQADPGICWMGCIAAAAGLNGWKAMDASLSGYIYVCTDFILCFVPCGNCPFEMIFGEDRCAAWTQWLQSTLSKGGVKVCSSVPPVTLCFAFDKRSLSFASLASSLRLLLWCVSFGHWTSSLRLWPTKPSHWTERV